jgi:16S rRNA (guanine527-N7)-methyltransferase
MLEQHFPNLSSSQLAKFNQLPDLYREWNEKINVISRKDIDQLMLHHVLHSLSIAKFITFVPGTMVIDIGTGGGFPGIPLAIYFPETDFLLVDSIGKKITVATEVSKSLNLTNVRAIKSRAEEIDAKCDFVVSRAVAPVNEIIGWTKKLILPKGHNAIPNGWIFLKGGDLDNELKEVEEDAIRIDISTMFIDPYFEGKKVVYVKR